MKLSNCSTRSDVPVSGLVSIICAKTRLAQSMMLMMALALSPPSSAEQQSTEQMLHSDAPLVLNGFATRKFLFIVDVYVGALFVEKRSDSAQYLLQSDQHRLMQFEMLRDVRGRRIMNAFYEGMQLNVSPEKIKTLEPQIRQAIRMFDQKLREGETAVLEYIPSVGTKVILAGVDKGIVPGKELFDAILSIWIGEHPVSEDFKQHILGAT